MPVEIRPIPQAELDSVREMMILGTAHECIGVTISRPIAHLARPALWPTSSTKLIQEDLLGGEALGGKDWGCGGEGTFFRKVLPPRRALLSLQRLSRAYRIPVRGVPRPPMNADSE